MIKRVIGTCDSSEFFPCACCDPSSHLCVHKSTSIFGQFSKCRVFKIFNSSCELDTSMYCCIPKVFARNEVRNDNITLFHKYCKKYSSSIDPSMSLVNRIIPSCDPISKKCHHARTSEDTARPPKPMVVLPPEDTTISILMPKKIIPKKEQNDNKKALSIIEQYGSNIQANKKQQDTEGEEIDTDESTNRAVIEFQSISSLVLILIITIAFVTIN